MIVMISNVVNRKEELDSSRTETIVRITDLNYRTKGSTTRTTDAYYEFLTTSGQVIKGKTQINNPAISVGNCYKAQFAASNPDIVEIYFGEAVQCP